MKKIFLIFIFLISFSAISQSINDYQYVIVPVKFSFMSKDNLYRISTMTKFKLTGMGLTAFYNTDALPTELYNNRCDKLYVDIEKSSSMFMLKLVVIFRDCKDNIVFKSEPGISKKKDFDESYKEAIDGAFKSIIALNYKYNGKAGTAVSPIIEKNPIEVKQQPAVVKQSDEARTTLSVSSSGITVENTANGYLIVDESSSRILYKLLKTSDPKVFIANQQSKQGVLINKDGTWFFEYYQNDKLVSEKTELRL